MRLKLQFSFLLISAFTFTVCAQKTQSGWKVLNESAYSIQYPSNWTLDQTGAQGVTFVINSEPTGFNDFKESVNLIIHDLRGTTINLDKLVKQSESTFPATVVNFKLIESTRLKDSGEYHKIVFTGDKGKLKLKFVQYLRVKGIKAYVTTFTAEQSQFDSYKETGEKILSSFKVK